MTTPVRASTPSDTVCAFAPTANAYLPCRPGHLSVLDYPDVLDHLDVTGPGNGTVRPTVAAAQGCCFPPGKDAPEDIDLTIDGAVGLAHRESLVRHSRASLCKQVAGIWLMLAITVAGPCRGWPVIRLVGRRPVAKRER
jgi:hypothetical protein